MNDVVAYFTSARFIESLMVILVGIGIIVSSRVLDKRHLKSKSSNSRWYKSAKRLFDFINAMITLILFFAILAINGVDVRKYIASFGIAGITLSFALQDLLKDVTMGLTIMFEGYFKVGDIVEYNGQLGKVVFFSVKTTKLFMLDNETTMAICNRDISQIGISSDWIDVDIPIGYDVDLHYARSLCRECAGRIERLRYVYSCDFMNTQELAESWIEYKLRVHCLSEKKPVVRRNALAVIQDVFYERGQEFPLSIKVLYNVDPDINRRNIQNQRIIEKDGTVVYESTAHKKRDYELGRGAAKSKVMPYSGSDEDIEIAVAEAERYAISENLDNKMKLRIRLLSEELLSLVKGIPNMSKGNFFVEREEFDYEICFEADGKINRKIRDELIEVSSNNTNEAYSGISGMIGQAIDSMLLMSNDDKKGLYKASMSTMEESIGKADDDYRWSYNVYKEKELQAIAERQIESDEFGNEVVVKEGELVKSVLTKLADDIKISVRTNHVNIRVLVKNEEDE